MEYVPGGELFDYIVSRGRVRFALAAFLQIALQILTCALILSIVTNSWRRRKREGCSSRLCRASSIVTPTWSCTAVGFLGSQYFGTDSLSVVLGRARRFEAREPTSRRGQLGQARRLWCALLARVIIHVG